MYRDNKTVAQLTYNPDTDRYELDGCDLHCGDCLTVLIAGKWVDTRIEYGEDWYLVGLTGYQIGGLFAKT